VKSGREVYEITRDSCPIDKIGYAPEDLTSDGKLPLVISAPRTRDVERIKRYVRDQIKGEIGEELPIVKGFSVEIRPKDLRRLLKYLPEGTKITLDSKIKFPDPRDFKYAPYPKPPTAGEGSSPTTPGTTPPAEVPPSEKPGGLDVSRATLGIQKLWDQGYTGKGVGIAIIDSGIYPHPDLKDKIKGWVDIAEGKEAPYDSFGHGTHVAGDAAGTGVASAGEFKGIAPDADLIGIRITTVAEAIKGIQWAIENKDKYNIKVLNMSLGDFATKSYRQDPWAQAAEKAVKAGLAVVVAAGNEGPDAGTISTPGIDPNLITVGAVDDRKTLTQEDDSMAPFSSRGPTSTDNLTKPDILAPGVSIWGPLSPKSTMDVPELPHKEDKYFAISGTSMATPMIAGLTALLLQANPNLTHAQIKDILQNTARKLPKEDVNSQGYGMVNPEAAMKVALQMKSEAAGTAVA
jgi:serine protease AprX